MISWAREYTEAQEYGERVQRARRTHHLAEKRWWKVYRSIQENTKANNEKRRHEATSEAGDKEKEGISTWHNEQRVFYNSSRQQTEKEDEIHYRAPPRHNTGNMELDTCNQDEIHATKTRQSPDRQQGRKIYKQEHITRGRQGWEACNRSDTSQRRTARVVRQQQGQTTQRHAIRWLGKGGHCSGRIGEWTDHYSAWAWF